MQEQQKLLGLIIHTHPSYFERMNIKIFLIDYNKLNKIGTYLTEKIRKEFSLHLRGKSFVPCGPF